MRALSASTSSSTEQQFVSTHKNPFLLLPIPTESESFDGAETGWIPRTPPMAFNTITDQKNPITQLLKDYGDAAVIEIVKSDRNTFAQMITVGRAPNNDIVIPIATLSKIHGYFSKKPDGTWQYTDAGSTNGSWLSGERLPSRGSVPVDDGCELYFGPEVHALFKLPPGLYNLARIVAGRPSA